MDDEKRQYEVTIIRHLIDDGVEKEYARHIVECENMRWDDKNVIFYDKRIIDDNLLDTPVAIYPKLDVAVRLIDNNK